MSAWGVRGVTVVAMTAGLVVGPLPVVRPAQAAVVPCPYGTTPTGPPKPTPPVRNSAAPSRGGDDLPVSGLILPPGAAAPPTLSAMSCVVSVLDTGAVL